MRRGLAIAALLATSLSLPAWAQRHGNVGGFAGHSGFGTRGSTFGSRGPGFGGAGHNFGPRVRAPFFFSNRFGRSGWSRGYSWAYPSVGGYYVYPSHDSDYALMPPQGGFQGYDRSASDFDSTAQIQQDEIDRLESEVDRLHQERENQSQPPKPEAQSRTLLIFQDHHSEEVLNYAIVGQTLWVFTDLRARKLSLTGLDVPATIKANEERGVSFRLP